MKLSKYICVICKRIKPGFGNNPYPIKNSGRCCNNCNFTVIKARLQEIKND